MLKDDLLNFLLKKRAGKVVAYGAAAKGNTLLNYAGVKPDLLPFVCDASLAKQESICQVVISYSTTIGTIESTRFCSNFTMNIAKK